MRVLITGAAGFIGTNFLKLLLQGNLEGVSEIVVLDKLTYAASGKNLDYLTHQDFRFVQGDICDKSLLDTLLRKTEIVVNFAAESHVDRSIQNAEPFTRTNIVGVQNLLECSLKNDVGTFIQVSTDEVYGSIEYGSWTEESPLLPNSPYSASKGSADLLARAYNRTYGMDIRITRCSNNYGPFQFPEKAIPLFILQAIENKPLTLYGNGLNVRDWLYVEDHCRGIFKVIEGGKAGEIYNIGGGTEMCNLDLARMILRILDKDEDRIVFVEDRKAHDFRYSINCTKIEQSLQYLAQIPFEIGVGKTISWYLENAKWWKPLVRL